MSEDFEPTSQDLLALYDLKYRGRGVPGWGPRMRLAFGYFTPDDYYEALLAKLINPGCLWADVGCGRDLFASNPALAAVLAQRCRVLFGVDPDDNIKDNPYLTESFQGTIEACGPARQFDVITLRMVAEHITDPQRVVAKLGELARPGGLVIVYTPNKRSPMSVGTALLPFRLHQPLKSLLWATESPDTFPTVYRLNTRRDLRRDFSNAGFVEVLFRKLDDCRIFNRYRLLNFLELSIWSAFRFTRLPYPETCLLAVFRKVRAQSEAGVKEA